MPLPQTTRKELERKFDKSQLKQKKGNFGKMLTYIEGAAVVQRLNDCLEAGWNFEVVDHWINEDAGVVIVLGRLTVLDPYDKVIVKQQFGTSDITRHKESKKMIQLGDDLKSAATDALKKCASMLGVGLYLYSETLKPNSPPKPKEQPPKGRNKPANGSRGKPEPDNTPAEKKSLYEELSENIVNSDNVTVLYNVAGEIRQHEDKLTVEELSDLRNIFTQRKRELEDAVA